MVVGKKTKSFITAAIWILAIIVFAFTMLQILNPREHTVDKAIYSSQVSSTINYSIRLANTPVYNRAKDADPAKYYLMPFTDYMSLNCSYSLTGNDEAMLTTDSYVTAFLISYIEEGGEEVILWKKEYALAELETNNTTGTSIEETKNIEIEFEDYSALIDQIYDTYNFKSSYYLMVVYTTEFNVTYGENTVKKVLQPYLRINIDDLLFEVEENNLPDNKLEITQQVTVTDEVDWDVVIIGGIIFILLAMLAILLPTKILTGVSLSEEARKIRQITIKYGDRIINISEKPIIDKKAVKVESIEDVAKIADEIGQPIFCLKADREIYYYVINNDVMYYINLKSE